MKKEVYIILETIKKEINELYVYVDGTPCINYGPCGVFAYLFYQEWMALFHNVVHICFVMTKDRMECYHICLRFDTKELYDGGIGIHSDEVYKNYILQDMLNYDHKRLETWSYGLDRMYPRYCPSFDKAVVKGIIHNHLLRITHGYN